MNDMLISKTIIQSNKVLGINGDSKNIIPELINSPTKPTVPTICATFASFASRVRTIVIASANELDNPSMWDCSE